MRNSDRYKTAKERSEAFREYCRNKGELCRETQGTGCIDCQMLWLDLEAEAEEPLPCPFCGGEMLPFTGNGCALECRKCEYRSGLMAKKESAIAAHNRVARAVKEKEAC